MLRERQDKRIFKILKITIFKCDFSYSHAAVDKIFKASRGPSAITLLVV